ncbi:acyl-CoA dehydrogenase family protein [Streptomyces sp. NPDC048254]|uniref:acyl-CoA dehydrogenase family protein n=1 Tax=Streptomyces sp. NPDC048254 TaxID=3365525 RepID=UPI0037115FD5
MTGTTGHLLGQVSSDQELAELRTAVRDFFEAKSSEAAVRKLLGAEPRFDRQVWDLLCDQLRLTALAVPEEYGGDGFGLMELGTVLEEAGRALLCAPLLSTAVLATQTLLAWGDDDACARYLPEIAAGRRTATLAAAEDSGSWRPQTITTRAEPGNGPAAWALTGTKSFVLDGTTADLLLVLARTGVGLSLFAVEPSAAGVRTRQMPVRDETRALATVSLDAAPAVLVGGEGDGDTLLPAVLDIVATMLAAEQAGGARRCLDSAAEYARTRYQFGRAIGSFQAVKHKCADMLVQVELAEAAAREAARLHAEGAAGFPVASATAHACGSRAYMFCAMENIQVHGGIGFTWEHPAHLYFRRAKSSQLLLGGPVEYHERLLHRLGI